MHDGCMCEQFIPLWSEVNSCILLFVQEMIDEADKDGDGEVSEAEFLRIMKKTNMY